MSRIPAARNPGTADRFSELGAGKRGSISILLHVLYNRWFQCGCVFSQNGKGRSEPIPDRIVVPKLLKELSRELRHAERNSAIGSGLVTIPTKLSLAKPVIKPEKEPSKRIRRKPQARADFVDINEALSNFAAEEVLRISLEFCFSFWALIYVLRFFRAG